MARYYQKPRAHLLVLGLFLIILDLSEGRYYTPKPVFITPPTATAPNAVPITEVPPTPTLSPNVDLRRRAVSPTLASVDGYTHLGCYQDGSNHILSVTSEYDNGMTPELCRNVCSIASCSMFGLENGYECFCGNQIEAFAVPAPQTDCTESCWGQSEAICGAGQRINVYSATTGGAGDSGATTATTTGGSKTNTGALSSTSKSGSGSSSGGSSDSSTSSNQVVLSIGAVAGIAVGAAGFASIITAGIILLFCRRGRRDKSSPTPAMAYAHPPPMPHSSASYPQVAPQHVYDGSETTSGYAKTDYHQTPSLAAVAPISISSTPPARTLSPPAALQQRQQNYYEMQAPVAYEMPGGLHR